ELRSKGWSQFENADDRQLNAENGRARSLENLWRALQTSVRSRIQPGQFETWFRRAVLLHADDGVLRIALQDKFARGWLESHYREVIEIAAKEVFGSPRRAEFLVDPEAVARPLTSTAES